MTTAKPTDHFLTRFQSIVDQFGDRPAVVENGKTTLTYSQLWNSAGQIAAWLKSENIFPRSVVAISLKKSADWIAVMLGVWRCGAAWVPIEPTLPQDRIDFLLQDSRATWIVNRQNLSNVGSVTNGIEPTGCSKSLEDLAYLIYTSGTTGKPKGVEVSHRFLVPMLDQQIEAIGMDCFSRSLFLLSTSFDAAISDIGTALLSGAALHIESSLEQDGRFTATPKQLLQVLADREISYVDCPPSLLTKLNPQHCPSTLKTVLVGGEVCPPEVIRKWAAVVRLINVYGPTECTICSSFSICSPTTGDHPLIGQPLAGVEYRIDEESNELLIGGECVAIGYRNRPSLTEKKFVLIENKRFYCTGDRVKRDSDGEYVFLGRIDRQIKVRGHRIEPMEIEAILLQQTFVLQAAVVLQQNKERSRLVAFIVTNQPATPELRNRLRASVRQRLPEYSTPQRWEFLNALPTSPAGKIDYQKLRLSTLGSERKTEPNESLTESEQLLFVIFSTVLKHRQFKASDSFIAAGGDSLSAIEVMVLADAVDWSISPHSLLGPEGSATAIAKNRRDGSKNDTWSTNYLRTDVGELIDQSEFEFEANQPSVGSRWEKPKRVLLTGATGFLGARLLVCLLRSDPPLEIVCLVRGNSDQVAHGRLFEFLNQQKIRLTETQKNRVCVCAGNIEQKVLGLPDVQYTQLAASCDHVVHSAAQVNSVLSYQQLRAANVTGTLNIAIFAATGRPKRIDAISTLSVFVGSDRCCGVHRETDCLEDAKRMHGGYAASKWAAEFLLRSVSNGWQRNRIRYFRPGLLTADTTTGIAPNQDLLTLTVRGLTKLGIVPKVDPRFKVDITPVDLAAHAIAKLILRNTQSDTFHFAHPDGLPANALFDGIRHCNKNVDTLDPTRFKQQMKQGQLDAATTIVALALDRALQLTDTAMLKDLATPRAIDLFQATEARFDMSNTIAELNAINDDWSPPSLESAFVNKLVSTLLNE